MIRHVSTCKRSDEEGEEGEDGEEGEEGDAAGLKGFLKVDDSKPRAWRENSRTREVRMCIFILFIYWGFLCGGVGCDKM